MAYLSNEQLALLNALMYAETDPSEGSPLDNDVWSKLWKDEKWRGDKTLGDLLSCIPDSTLNDLASQSEPYGERDHTSGAEWAAIIQAIKKDDTLCRLTCADMDSYTDKGSKVVCFTSGEDVYVVFKGTGDGEWPDNFAGMDTAGTPQQRAATNYVNYIHNRYGKNVTVSGHSKGANKAQYATITSPYVNRCVAFDGQGFGPSFMRRYKDQIAANQGKITAYNHYREPVSSLLFPIAGSVHYVQGVDVGDDYLKTHAMISLFQLDENGNIVLDENGQPMFDTTEQSALSREIAEFTSYLMNAASDADRESITNLFMGMLSAEGSEGPLDVFTDPENAQAVGLLLAYLLAYGDWEESLTAVGEIIPQEVTDFLSGVLRQVQLAGVFNPSLLWSLMGAGGIIISGALLIFILSNYDWFLTVVGTAASTYPNITYRPSMQGGFDEAAACGLVRDFTRQKRDELLAIIDQIEAEPWFDPSTWDIRYRAEQFFGRLTPQRYQQDMNTYYRKIMDINGTSAAQIRKIFADAESRDAQFASDVCKVKDNVVKAAQDAAVLQLLG